jgi:Holliday junction resolvase RusA-like endonuclease
MSAVEFVAYGVPIPKGSMKAFMPKGARRPVVTSDNSQTKPWEEIVRWAAVEAMGKAEPLEGPVELRVTFFLPRPASAPKRVTRPTKKPDLDKLIRAVKDAMKRAGVYRDDAQVVQVEACKVFAAGIHDLDGARGLPRAAVSVGLVS